MRPARLLAAAVAALALLCVPACGADPASGSTSPTGNQQLPAVTDHADALPTRQPTIDACSLIHDDEATEILGRHDGAVPEGSISGGSWCSWDNPETSESITLRLGAEGSAPGGELPAESYLGPTEPGPDGIRFAPMGVAEFVLDDRACEVQVVTNATDTDPQTAVRLIGLIRARA